MLAHADFHGAWLECAVITAATNPKLKLVRKLLAQKRKRDELGLFAVEGEDLVAAAAAAGIEPVELLVAGETVEPDAARGDLDAAASRPRRSAVYRTADLPREPRETTLALWRVADPGNVGTLLRAADAFGAAVALSEGCADPLGPKALRASAGAIFRVPLVPFDDAPGRRIALVAHGGTPLARARPRRRDDLRPRSGARGAAGGAGRLEQQGRDDRASGRGRVAERRRRGRDRALRALAPRLALTREEPADRRCRRGLRRLVAAPEAPVGDRIARVAELLDDARRPPARCGRTPSSVPCEMKKRGTPTWLPPITPPGDSAMTEGKRSPLETPSDSA